MYSSANMSNIKNNYDEWCDANGHGAVVKMWNNRTWMKLSEKKSLIEKLESKLVYAINCWHLRHATNTDRFGNDDNSVAKLAALTHTEQKRRGGKMCVMLENEGLNKKLYCQRQQWAPVSQNNNNNNYDQTPTSSNIVGATESSN